MKNISTFEVKRLGVRNETPRRFLNSPRRILNRLDFFENIRSMGLKLSNC